MGKEEDKENIKHISFIVSFYKQGVSERSFSPPFSGPCDRQNIIHHLFPSLPELQYSSAYLPYFEKIK
jgi:hypothetical protein